MLRTILVVGAALALAGGVAAAQDAARYVDEPAVISAQMSPGGGEVAFIRRTEDLQQRLIVNLATRQTRAIQTMKQSQHFDLDWVRWRGDSGASSNVFSYWRGSIGDPDKDREALAAASPRKLAAKAIAPVLLSWR